MNLVKNLLPKWLKLFTVIHTTYTEDDAVSQANFKNQ